MIDKIKEKISLFIAKNPSGAILFTILVFNVLLLFSSAVIICTIAQADSGLGFWQTIFYVITMILDAGCIQFIMDSVNSSSLLLNICCILIIVVGMVSFTGAVIGYITNTISSFIDASNSGKNELYLSDHTIILNWNSRASEIVNDLLFLNRKETIVVLVESGKELIEKEIRNKFSETIDNENKQILKEANKTSWLEKRLYLAKYGLKNKLSIIIREGDVYSSKQLHDIALAKAKSIIILHREIQNTLCKFEYSERAELQDRGNTDIIKTLITVSDIASGFDSADDQQIVVEIDDEWTLRLVEKIIQHKQKHGKCNIVPIPINRVLGQILSQFSIMPELNYVYSELFSNKGGFFASARFDDSNVVYDESSFVEHYLNTNRHIVPLTLMETTEGKEYFYVTDDEAKLNLSDQITNDTLSFRINPNFMFNKKKIIILGHNSKMISLLEGFNSFRTEWHGPNEEELLDITIIDEGKYLAHFDYYEGFPYVSKVVDADIYDQEKIYNTINEVYDNKNGDVSILILSDNMAVNEEVDAKALTYLIYVQDIIHSKKEEDPNFDINSIDVVVEVLNPKNYDVVRSYSINNVVISNRYVSKMVTQIGEKKAIFDFYSDILTYDISDTEFDSKELYIKNVRDFFVDIPEKCTAEELIRGIYYSSPVNNRSITLGYVTEGDKVIFFFGDQKKIEVELKNTDKLIIFSNH